MGAPRLVALSGLPGSGKSTLAAGLARALPATLLAVDPIEAAMRRGGVVDGLTGVAAYTVAATLAETQLDLRLSAVIDAANAAEPPRALWREMARRTGAVFIPVECVCGDRLAHRRRVEAGEVVTWARVEQRREAFEPWAEPHLALDTTAEAPDALVQRVLDHIAGLSSARR